MKRSKHSLSHYKLASCFMGKLIPVSLIEALPGDTFQQSTSILLRLMPILAPVMHPVNVRVHHWFVPNRLVWKTTGGSNGTWEDFITGGKDGLGNGATYPTNAAPITPTAGELLDYLGVRPGIAHAAGSLNLMPVRVYNLIYNEFYRDEDLITEVAQDDVTVKFVAWEKDYFTSARPWTQKGPAVGIPIGGSAPVILNPASTANQVLVRASDHVNPGGGGLGLSTEATTQALETSDAVNKVIDPNGTLIANLAAATSPDIIAFRRAFALQRYQEARAQYGSRYTEYLRYLGIRSSDARLQRPEYLGGGKQTVAFSEVLRTGNIAADAATQPIGQMKGHGIAAMRSNRYRYFCEEHGYIMTLVSIRPRSMYVTGLDRTWSRRTKEDYYQKELELIGQQEVRLRELFTAGTGADANIFGYQDRYAEYRHHYSSIAGDFRTTDLDFWHMARIFGSAPTLNQSFIECDPTKRIFAEQTKHNCLMMVSHSIQARRLLGKKTIGRII